MDQEQKFIIDFMGKLRGEGCTGTCFYQWGVDYTLIVDTPLIETSACEGKVETATSTRLSSVYNTGTFSLPLYRPMLTINVNPTKLFTANHKEMLTTNDNVKPTKKIYIVIDSMCTLHHSFTIHNGYIIITYP